MYEPFDETAARVLLAVNPGDSIRTVAQHLHSPYETVRQTVNQLEDAGYLRYDDGLFLTNDRVVEAARDLLATSAAVNPPSIEEAYVLPQFGDWPFAFTRVDAVYVWTQGGYQVSRDPDDYPLFLAVLEEDVDAWQCFFERFGIPTGFERRPEDSFEGPLQIVLNEHSVLNPDHVEGYPVISRGETIAFMQEHYATFQSALAMLDRMYDDLDLDVSYRESERKWS
ncbi:MarR family transcriptional regulator [Haloplanus pelagicus]|uniref:MarR family transcriptional regulator n=1 Tax=Haloplanus pelagicus TaxID=2949995 RepID=UPI00203AC3CE|nr:helix-turn-helix domain-containing protein [Haloplanus sp. HW8-1]